MRVLALKKCAGGTFLAKSVRRVLKCVRISVAERKVCKAKPPHTVKSFCPCQKDKESFYGSFSFSFVQRVLKTRRAERVEGCGCPVDTSKHRRCLEAPTEPAGENKSLKPLPKRETDAVWCPFFIFRIAIKDLNP